MLSSENMEQVVENAFSEIEEYVSNAKFSTKEPNKSIQNGVEVLSWRGTGKAKNGDNVQFQLAILSIPDSSKKPLLALTYAEAESMKEHQAELAKFYQSLRKQ